MYDVYVYEDVYVGFVVVVYVGNRTDRADARCSIEESNRNPIQRAIIMEAFVTRLAERSKSSRESSVTATCVDRAVARAATLSKLGERARPCGMTVAAPTTPGSSSRMIGRKQQRRRRGGELEAGADSGREDDEKDGTNGERRERRPALGKIDANSPVGVAGRITTVADAVAMERRRADDGATKTKTTRTAATARASAAGGRTPGGKSRLARSRSASDELAAASGTDGEDEDFVGVESFAEMLARVGLDARGALRETQRRALEEVYEESLEARSLRTVLENVKEAELEMAREESERRMAWVKSLEGEIEKKWANRVEETERENAQLRVEVHTQGLALDASKEKARQLSRALEKAPEAAPAAPEKKMVTAETQTPPLPEAQRVVEAPANNEEEVEALKRALAAANARVQNEVRQHAGEFDALNDELAAKDAMIQRLRREVSEMKDRTSFYERCANTADERANNAEANSHALREEFLVLQSDVKKLNEQMHRNAKNAAEEKESIMAALAAAQARASEAEAVPVAAKLNIADALISNETVCKCGSVATAQRLSAALADATARNSELQSKVTMLENKLEMREVSDDVNDDEVERLEKRALAAERRLSVAREAMTRYVSESQKCSPCPTVYNTVDELTPMKRAVEKWIEVSDAKHADEKESDTKNAEEEEEENSDSDDEFDTPQRHRGMLPTPRLRARIAIRRTRGPPPKKPLAAYKPAAGDELCRRARAIGMSDSPFARKRD